MDESILLVYPEEVLEGRIPSRDFFTVYGLGNYLLLAGVYTISEPSLLAERLVGLSYQVAIVAALVRLCSRHGLVAAMSAALIGVLIFSGPFLLALSWLGGLAIFLWSLSLLQSSGARWCLISAGVLAGLVPFWRLEMAILLVAAIPLIRSLAQFRSFATGLAIGLVPVGAHLLVAGGAIWENVFLNRMGIDAQRDPSLLAPTVVAAACILVCSVAYLIWRSRLSRPDASTGITVLLLLPQAFQRTDYVHVVLMTGSVIVPLAVAPLMARVNVREARLAVAGLCAAATALTSLLVMQAVSTPDGIRLSRGDHSLHVASGSELVLDGLSDQ